MREEIFAGEDSDYVRMPSPAKVSSHTRYAECAHPHSRVLVHVHTRWCAAEHVAKFGRVRRRDSDDVILGVVMFESSESLARGARLGRDEKKGSDRRREWPGVRRWALLMRGARNRT